MASCNKEKKVKKTVSKTKGLKKTVTSTTSGSETTKEPWREHKVVNHLKPEPGMWLDDEMISRQEEEAIDGDLKPMTELKHELSVASQHPLGGQSKHWKCGQCKLVFESGPQLPQHLDFIKKSKVKCMACHLVYVDRKDLITHRRKHHQADLLRLKFDPENEPKVEPESLEDKIYEANAIGEFICDTCDRAFKDK